MENYKVFFLIILVSCFVSCATYRNQTSKYYSKVEQKEYSKANSIISTSSYFQSNRNKFLYYVERGRLFYLMNLPDSSSFYLNLADHYLDANRQSFSDVVKSLLINPAQKKYLGEEFEKFFVNYYKGLNYIKDSDESDALVEAKIITLKNNYLFDKTKGNGYYNDPLSLIFQGVLFEKFGYLNDAYISFKNALKCYENESSAKFLHVNIPFQLKKDLIRLSRSLGLESEASQYISEWNISSPSLVDSVGDLVLFVEQGHIPVKSETNIVLTKNSDGINGFGYFDPMVGGMVSVQLDITPFNNYCSPEVRNDFLAGRLYRIVIPTYVVQTPYKFDVSILNDSSAQKYYTDAIENFNSVSIGLLEKRMPLEITTAILRQVFKASIEKGVEASVTSMVSSKHREAPDNNAKLAGELAGLIVNIVNNATEKADTRNWQSLPAFVDYIRVPLKKGLNSFSVHVGNLDKQFTVLGDKTIKVVNLTF